jgi:hypothetical protein
MNEFEWQVDLKISAHSGKDDLDLNGVADDHAEEVVGIAGLRDRRTCQVRFIANLIKNIGRKIT